MRTFKGNKGTKGRGDNRKQLPSRGPQRGSSAGQARPQNASRGLPDKGPLFPRHLRPIVGDHAIKEALAVRPKTMELAWFESTYESNRELVDLFRNLTAAKIKCEIKPEIFLSKVAASHQGVVLFSNETPEVDWQALLTAEEAIVLVLDGLEDPHNLGAILRTGWLMEVSAVLLPQDRSVTLGGTVHKVACGGVEHVPVLVVNQFGKYVEELKQNGFWIYGLSHKGKNTVFDLKLPKKVAWVIGSEDRGMRTTTEKTCDELVRIPQASANASYNASVATGMALLETRRQFNL